MKSLAGLILLLIIFLNIVLTSIPGEFIDGLHIDASQGQLSSVEPASVATLDDGFVASPSGYAGSPSSIGDGHMVYDWPGDDDHPYGWPSRLRRLDKIDRIDMPSHRDQIDKFNDIRAGRSVKARALSPGPGDWVVTGVEVRRDETIILTGNLVIEPGGNLTLINVTLYMNSTYDGEFQIHVKRGGEINILSGSTITAYKYRYLFQVYGKLRIEDSKIQYIDYPGLYIETQEETTIKNTTITNNYNGIYINQSSNIYIINNIIVYNGDVGVEIYDSSSISITDNTIENNSDVGIYIGGSSNISITNNIIVDNGYWSIVIRYSSKVSITNNTIKNNEWDGINIDDSSNISIKNNTIKNNGDNAIDIVSSSKVSITNNTIEDNGLYGIEIYKSFSLSVVGNVFVGDGIVLVGDRLAHFVHDIRGNTVNGRPLYYILNVEDYTIPGDAGQIIIVYSKNITINQANITKTDTAIQIISSNKINIKNTTTKNNILGIDIWYSSSISITNNNIVVNYYGIYIDDSSSIFITNNNIVDNGYDGIYIWYDSSNISITDNIIENNGGDGIDIEDSSNISIKNNTIKNNGDSGISIRYHSFNISIKNNIIENNGDDGIYIEDSFNVFIHYCNIYGNVGHGVYVIGKDVVDASYNWWNSTDGPEYKAEGDPYDPEEVYSVDDRKYLIYEPWLTGPFEIITTPPKIMITSPASGITLNVTSITVEWIIEEGTYDVVRVEVRLDDGEWIDVTGLTRYTFKDIPEGIHRITIRAIDEEGNTSQEEIEFYIELPKPTQPTKPPTIPTENLTIIIITIAITIIVAITAIKIKTRKH